MLKYIVRSTRKSKLVIAAFCVCITSFEGIVLSYIITQGSDFVADVETRKVLNYFAIALGGWIVVYVSSYFFQITVNSIIKDLNTRIKSEYLKSALINTDTSESEVISFITNDMKMLETTYFNSLFRVIQMTVTAIVSAVAMLMINLPVSVLFIALSFLPNLISKLFKTSIEKRSKEWSESNVKTTGIIDDIIGGRNTLRVYAAGPSFYNKLQEEIESTESSNVRMNDRNQLANLFIYIASGVSFILPFVIGIILSTRFGYYSVSTLVSVFLLNDRVVGPLRNINQFTTLFQKTSHVREKILEVSEEDLNFPTSKDYNLAIGLSVDNLCLQYDNKIVLNSLNFEWRAGEKVLILGESGSGKTSLMNILTGKISPTEGEVFLTDANGIKMPIEQNGFFNLIEQSPHIFEGKLNMNITLNNLKESVIEDVQTTTFLDELSPDHFCEKDGGNLSGGQVQRIEIARALYQNNPIYFIDEMTASLNKEMGEAIRNHILSLPNMVVEIAHHYDEKVLEKYTKVYQMKQGTLNLVQSR